jgi:beta-galactosidase
MSRSHAVIALIFCLACNPVGSQTQRALAHPSATNVVDIDASQPIVQPETGFLHLGGTSSTGHDLEINSRYLTLDGKPMLPIMAEFHYSRYPAQDWEDEILKMKADGVNVISTYIFWIHHEEIEGQFDWSGQRDLRRFVELCGKHGLYVYLRIGPWDHGEVRNGGLPDWVLKLPNIRTNDPAYLAHVARFDGEIAAQVKGLLFKDGGPVIGLQLENEYGLHGPGRGAEHILKLKQLAIAAGLTVPLYSVTGWPSLDFPPHDVIPVSGGYPDGFWFNSLTNLPPSMNYLFNLNRKLGDMGATVSSDDPTGKVDLKHDPYFGAEEAAGMQSAYHRRPLLKPDDIGALTVTGIGSGLNLYGYYLFHGGTNPEGKLSTLQESQATGYPNDLAQLNYDFQAPLGEYGQVRESYRRIRPFHLFLNTFGSDLAPMIAVGPDQVPTSPADTSVPRLTFRGDGESGFIFVNNYVRQLQMPSRKGFQVRLKLANSRVAVPAEPLTVPANSYFCWPVNLTIGGIRLQYSTAQLLTRIETPGDPTYFFFAIPGIAPQFSFAKEDVKSLTASGGAVSRTPLSIGVQSNASATTSRTIELVNTAGEHSQIILLTHAEAESATLMRIDGADHLMLSPADVFFDGNQLHLRSTDRQALNFKVFPALRADAPTGAAMTTTRQAGWSIFRFNRPAVTFPFLWTKIRNAKSVPPVAMGPISSSRKTPVALVPGEQAFDAAAEWRLDLTRPLPTGISNVWLSLDYTGDIARLYLGNKLVDDDFFHGSTWQIGLKRLMPEAIHSGIRIQVLPLRVDAPIYLDPRVKSRLPIAGQIALSCFTDLTPLVGHSRLTIRKARVRIRLCHYFYPLQYSSKMKRPDLLDCL